MTSSTGTSDPAAPGRGRNRRPGAARVPGDPRVTTLGLRGWVDRGVALMCLAALVPTLTLAYHQLPLMRPEWLMVVVGAIVASSILMPVYAWSDRGVRLPAVVFASAVLAGMLSWPLAWLGGDPPGEQPWLWMGLIVATACTAIVFGYRIGLAYLGACAVATFVVRLTPSGGAASVLLAFQDTLLAVAQPAALIACLHYARRAVRDLDDALARTHTDQAEDAVRQALAAERARLDALVHDEVMTTLVAAARSSDDAASGLADQARAALASLERAEVGASVTDPLSPDQFTWLLEDVVAAVAPTATFGSRVTARAGLLPHAVVTGLAQATREVCLNAARHADATSVAVEVEVGTAGACPVVRVTVTDDGVGFDPDRVAPERLGLRVSVRERLRVLGGDAQLDAAPGRGTRAVLTWSGPEVDAESATSAARRTDFWFDHPIFIDQDVAPYAYAMGGLMTVYTLVGWLSIGLYRSPVLAGVAFVLVAIATPLALSSVGRQMTPTRSWGIVALALAASLLSLLALEPGRWLANTTWFSGAVCLLLVTVRSGNRPVPAWVGASLHGIVVLLVAATTPVDFVNVLGVALAPLVWVGLLEFFIDWLGRVQVQLEDAEARTLAASAANATAFGSLVLREVWLTDLRAQVGPLLQKLAVRDQPLTDADRALCLVTEGALRDQIRARNLTSPALAALILEARLRGVQVTLVDNRGSDLPPNVRAAALRRLEATVRAMASGRLVARTAPEGYDEAVTIVAVGTGGAATLTTIDNDGAITVRS